MNPTGKIAPQPWMTAPETVAVFKALRATGAEARFVGGCVRDAILKRAVKDIDISTPLPPGDVMALLEAAGIKAVPTGIDHGTVTAVVGDKHFEITTLRVDTETYGRRARVTFTDDWEADAARRDFTINTLSSTLDGDVFDYFGALDDLGHGVVRFIGIPADRIDEDVLRLLRFFRFFAAYGRPPADADALAACRAAAPRLAELSGERVRGELLRILLGPNPADTVQLMRGERILDVILPECDGVGRLRMLAWLETTAVKVDGVGPDWVRRLGALFAQGTTGAQTQAVAERLRLSNDQTSQLAALTAPGFNVAAETGGPALRRLLYHHGAQPVRDVALLTWASELAVSPRQPRPHTDAWIALLEHVAAWRRPVFPVLGRDVLARGVAGGPAVGELISALETWWEDGDFQAGRESCLEELDHRIEGST